ncbi:adenine deaminase [Pelagibaculum spongiae]|uniref:Adenine deaminase n=1 Tax=Pelagibaculum spongiae TaxID=2080658 RepID=A0A2V1GRL3_9GAMM|nr:adenine deaminase [Pelagibaculum spongiae]PVZ64304.1 adenine deaminase [Pelagibaculum spongiae]
MQQPKAGVTDHSELQSLLAVARGDQPADLLITNIKVLDLINGGEFAADIAIYKDKIAGIGNDYSHTGVARIIDGKGATAVPGFIDGHMHVESSTVHPMAFEALTLAKGTTSIVCDPHEIVNVMGREGIDWFLRCSELMQQNMWVHVSSCVPALPGFETNGADFTLPEMASLLDNPKVTGLAEVMNFPGVINGDPDMLDKLHVFKGKNIDGHCPTLTGNQLNAYLAAGVQNCHETTTYDEGIERLRKGMSVIIREGSAARNLDALAKLITPLSVDSCLLCTDDRNPYEIRHEGHINWLVHRLINKHNIAPHLAYRAASLSAAKHFGFKHLGLLAPGKQADILLVNDLQQVAISEVLIAGKTVSELNLPEQVEQKFQQSNPPIQNTVQRQPLIAADLEIGLTDGHYHAIEIIPNELLTKDFLVEWCVGKGRVGAFVEDDIALIAVIERYGHQSKPALGLVRGFGIRHGAFAASVAHDSHNLVVIGKSPTDMATAVNWLIEQGGGFCTVNQQGQVSAGLELPLAGLMSLEPAEIVTEKITQLKACCKDMGVIPAEPFIQMAFLALPVIPEIKLTDKGLFNAVSFEMMSVKVG